MATIVETIASTAIFLFAGEPPVPVGTAFVIGYPKPDDPKTAIPFIVTAKHVLSDRSKIFARYSTTDPKKPGLAEYDLDDLRRHHDLFAHPDDGVDIVMFRTSVWAAVKMGPVPTDLIATRETFRNENIQATDRIVFPSL